MKNLFKTLTLVSLLCVVATSFAAPNSVKDRDFRQQKTAPKATATAENELPAALQEILLDSKPLDNTASDQTTNDNLYFSKMQNDGNLQNPQQQTLDNEIKPYASKITLTNTEIQKVLKFILVKRVQVFHLPYLLIRLLPQQDSSFT